MCLRLYRTFLWRWLWGRPWGRACSSLCETPTGPLQRQQQGTGGWGRRQGSRGSPWGSPLGAEVAAGVKEKEELVAGAGAVPGVEKMLQRHRAPPRADHPQAPALGAAAGRDRIRQNRAVRGPRAPPHVPHTPLSPVMPPDPPVIAPHCYPPLEQPPNQLMAPNTPQPPNIPSKPSRPHTPPPAPRAQPRDPQHPPRPPHCCYAPSHRAAPQQAHGPPDPQ